MDEDTKKSIEESAYNQALDEIYYNNYECSADADCFAFFADSDPKFISRYNEILNEKIKEYEHFWG